MSVASTARLLKGAMVVVLLASWAVAAHYGSAGKGSPDFNAALSVSPIVAMVAMLLWRVRDPAVMSVGALGAAALLIWLWPRLHENVPALYYIQHLGAHLALGVLFGRSLIGPGEPLITRIARTVSPDGISVRKARYTRQVTAAWTFFFFGNALISTLLFWLTVPAVWSIHANLLTGPLVALMFLAEHLWRIRILPPEERPSIAAAIRAYREGTKRHDTPPHSS
jgi:uncharacterized membrane protein